ncbi:MAG: EAL domain-containing protein [Lachnospiraceae bacterium]|nr:EAL domain-containing protein [Lachnospiraceae bacterium]
METEQKTSDFLDTNHYEETDRVLDSLFEHFPGCIVRIRFKNRCPQVEYVSSGFENVTTRTEEEFRAYFRKYENASIEGREEIPGYEFAHAAVNYGKGVRREYSIPGRDGKKHWVEIRSSIISKDGDEVLLQFVLFDITEQKAAEQQIKKEKKRLEIVAGLSADSIFEYDIEADTMQYYNRKELVIDEEINVPYVENYTKRVLQSAVLGKQFHPDDMGKMIELCRQLRSGKPKVYCEIRKQYEKGKYYWVSLEGTTITDENGKPTMVIGKISNIDEQIKREQELKLKAENDPLTGVYNTLTVKRVINDRLESASSNDGFLIVTDVDNFKHINDVMGHLFGDAVLCTFADALQEIFEGAIIGRIGGDEFMVYAEGLTEQDLFRKTEKVNQRFERIYSAGADGKKISATFGMTKRRLSDRFSLEKLTKQADTALYFLKEHAKGTAIFYNETHMRLQQKKTKQKGFTDTPENVISTTGDLVVFAHELFDSSADIKSALSMLCDTVTRFFRFQDVLYVRKDTSKEYSLRFHWGGDDVKQFYEEKLDFDKTPGWERLLKNAERNRVAVIREADMTEEENRGKSILAFYVDDGTKEGFCICVDRKNDRDWEEEKATLTHLGEVVMRQVRKHLEKRHLQEEAERKTRYDKVTGIPNYSYFLQYCEEYVAKNPGRRFALVYIDFVNFQYLNDVYGYATGDEILKEYAQLISEGTGIFHARVTADRFISLFELSDMEGVRKKTIAFHEAFCESVNSRYEQCKLGFVGGLAEIDRNLENFAGNVDNANVARKIAKQETKSPILVYTKELGEELQRQMEIVTNMSDALKAGEFVLYVQPKVNMQTNRVMGAEALVRWIKADGSVVSPGDFVPIFEKNGFITQLDFEMLRQVLEMQSGQLRKGKKIVPVSVNFSRKHQENPGYIRQLDDMLSKYEVPTKSLEIEITESVFMYDLAPLTKSIDQLKKRGLSISIDDFGAGYSSLNVLSRVKADSVKLDRQFLLDVETEQGNFTSEFLHLLINMIKQLGFKVIAEGVETEEQVRLLTEAGCNFAQGYFYAKPMPVAEYLEFLEENEIEE